MKHYINGQRYISLAEPELGLGEVTDLEGRKVTINYPLTEETRNYSTDSTSLIRCKFTAGDTIKSINGESFHVATINEEDGLFTYISANNDELIETQVDSDQGKVSALDRLKAGQIGSTKWFNLYRQLSGASSHINLMWRSKC